MIPSVLPGLSYATRLGDAPADKLLTVGIGLAGRDPAGELAAYRAMYHPASPSYRQFLTPAQYRTRFGTPAGQTKATVGWLRGGDLSIQTVASSGDYVTATGTVTQLDRLFRTRIASYRVGRVRFVADETPPMVPARLPITAVLGLDTLRRFYPPADARPVPSSGTYSGVVNERDLWKVYDLPRKNEGQGQSMGVFMEGTTDDVISNLRAFEQHERLPKVPVKVVLSEGGTSADYSDTAGAVEWYLDTQATTGMAPRARQLVLYNAKSLFDADVLAEFKKWADDPHGPRQMNASFGECEEGPTNPVTGPLAQQPYGTEIGDDLEQFAERVLRQATLEGRTLFTSAGDTGSGCPEVVVPVLGAFNGLAIQPAPEVEYPCASQYAVCVGGTVLTTDGTNHGRRVSETAWTFTGGGPSHYIPRPHFQGHVSAVNTQCLSKPDGTPYTGTVICRGTPDVAAMSGNVTGNGYYIYCSETSSEGGTSLSSPLWVGMWTRMQAVARHRVGLGFADEALYPLYGSQSYHRDFYDVTTSEYGAGNGVYRPATGWDYTTGLGAPDVNNLIRAIG